MMMYLLSLRQQLRSRRTWVMLLLVPALIFALQQYLPPEEAAAPVQVGVCMPEEGGEGFWDLLSQRSGLVVEFRQCSREVLEQKVATGQWDCGLVLARDFDRRIAALDTRELITVCISSSSTVYPLIQETAAAVVMELTSPVIAREYLEKNGISPTLAPTTALPGSQQVRISLETLSGEDLSVDTLTRNSTRDLLLGCIGLLLLLWAIFSAMDLGKWSTSAGVRRMTMVRSPAALLIPKAAACLTPAAVSALLGLALLRGSLWTVPALLLYLCTLGALALALCRWRPVQEALPCLMPCIVVLSFLFSPMVFDISRLFPVLAPLCRHLPLSLFLTACSGDLSALGILTLEGVFLLLLFSLSFRKK